MVHAENFEEEKKAPEAEVVNTPPAEEEPQATEEEPKADPAVPANE